MSRVHRRADPARVDALLRDGLKPADIAAMLLLQVSYVLERAKLVRLDATGQSVDVTSSRFARHDAHVAAILSEGGYPVCVAGAGGLRDAAGRPWRRLPTAA